MGLNDWFIDHLWITYCIIFVFTAYVYNKVFRVRKLPILKELILYLIIGAGSFMLLLFQVDAELPIVLSLVVAIVMMLLYRGRVSYTSWRNKDQNDQDKSN
ncbi:MAG: YlaH-like family protein [Paenibacillaceae bacterium]